MKRYKIIAYMLPVLFFTGCVTVEIQDLVYQPKVMYFDTPEVMGEFGSGYLGVQLKGKQPSYILGTAANVQVNGGADLTVTNEDESMEEDWSYGLRGNLGILKNTDIFYAGDGMFGIKTQLLGSPSMVREEGYKLAISASLGGNTSVDGRSISNTLTTYGNEKLTSKTTAKIKDATINFGYRFNDTKLVYMNLFAQRSDVEANLYKRNVSTPILSKQGASRAYGLLLGFQHYPYSNTFIIIETGVVYTTWPSQGKSYSYPIGLSSNFLW